MKSSRDVYILFRVVFNKLLLVSLDFAFETLTVFSSSDPLQNSFCRLTERFFSRPLPVWWSRISSWRSRLPLIACPQSTQCLPAEGVFGVFLFYWKEQALSMLPFYRDSMTLFIEKPRVSKAVSKCRKKILGLKLVSTWCRVHLSFIVVLGGHKLLGFRFHMTWRR